MKFFSVLFASILCFTVISAQVTGKVIKIYDGDTIQILDDDGGKFKIRFADIDAPQSTQEFGQESKKFLTSLIENKTVFVKFKSIDMYGRIVGTVYVDKIIGNIYKTNVNEEMVKTGHAWFFSEYSKDEKIKNFQLEARKNKIGLWKSDNPTNPKIYRKNFKK